MPVPGAFCSGTDSGDAMYTLYSMQRSGNC